MKTRFVKAILTLALALLSIPMQSQDYMNIFFKDGSFRKFYMKNVTEIFVSKTDAEGVVHSDYSYQHITTISDKYIYSLEDVDSITFTKRDDKIAEKNFVTAMPQVFNIIENCESIKDAESNIDKIKSVEGIADAWSDGHQLNVAIAEFETFSFHFDHGVDLNEDQIVNQLGSIKARLTNVVKSDGSPLKLVIANHLDKDEGIGWRGIYNYVVDQFKECGIDAYYENNPNIDFFYNNSDNPNRYHVYDYDIVVLDTHGGYDYIAYYRPDFWGSDVAFGMKGHSFVTAEDIGKPQKSLDKGWWEDNYKTFKEWRDKTPYHDLTDVHVNFTFIQETRNGKDVYVAHPELTEFFFRDIAPGKFRNPNSIFLNCACKSLKGKDGQPSHSFANILFDKNLGVYGGYTETTRFGARAYVQMLCNMVNGASVEQSKQKLPAFCKEETIDNVQNNKEYLSEGTLKDIEKNGIKNAVLELFSKSDNFTQDKFLFPISTIASNNEFINEMYWKDQTVSLEGMASLSYLHAETWGDLYTAFKGFDPVEFETGIELSTTQDFDSSLDYFPSLVSQRKQNNGICNFEATIPNLKPETTYYYRAYTFDGKYYNYGEPYSFKIEKQEEPDEPMTDKELMLSESVDGVDYKIYKKILDASDYHENPDGWKCYRSELSLETTANGSTNTIVLDNKIYLDDSKGHHGGQYPCILIDHKKDLFIVFCNSKDADYQYSMDCYSYVSSIKTLDFHREKVLDRVNMGWYPYFVENAEGLPAVAHFSYAGYYAMQSIRNDSGAWNTLKGSKINPGDFETKSKKAGQIFVIYGDGGEDNPPGGDDNPSTSCPAKITSVELINAGYFRNEEHPNRLYFNVNATLDNLNGIEEWGVYVDYDTKVEMPFKKVESQQTKTMAYSFKQDMRNDELIVFDLDSYVVEWDDEVGVYVKRRDSSSGELTTIYGDKYQFKLRYDTKPSMVLSDPVIVGTEVTGTENGYKKYKTTITYKYDLKGAFWIDYVDSAVSGEGWSFDGFDETWYPEYDHAGESEWVATYREDMPHLNHTNWRRLHLRNYETVNSNYVNFTGDGTLTEAWVTSNPVYSRARSNADTTQKCLIREVMIPAAAPEVKAVTSYKGGSLAEVAE